MAQPRWARLQGEYPCPLRHGAWYRIISTAPLEIVVDVNKKQVRIPRRHLELVEQPPREWAVVVRTATSPRASGPVGSSYAVCPSCRERVSLEGRPVDMRCPKCNDLFVVAWKGTPKASPSIQVMPRSEDRRPRPSIATVPRKRGPDRRKAQRREKVIPVAQEKRSGAERRKKSERRKGRTPRGPSAT